VGLRRTRHVLSNGVEGAATVRPWGDLIIKFETHGAFELRLAYPVTRGMNRVSPDGTFAPNSNVNRSRCCPSVMCMFHGNRCFQQVYWASSITSPAARTASRRAAFRSGNSVPNTSGMNSPCFDMEEAMSHSRYPDSSPNHRLVKLFCDNIRITPPPSH
jgi:hypothetical protein